MRRSSLLFMLMLVLSALGMAQDLATKAQGGSEVSPRTNTSGVHRVTLNGNHLLTSGFQPSAFVETGSTADVCLATYNTSNQPENLAPILCSAIEYRGKHGIRLVLLPFNPSARRLRSHC